jgi:hypothetical protein
MVVVVGLSHRGRSGRVIATIFANLLNRDTVFPDLIVEFCSANLAVFYTTMFYLPIGIHIRSYSHVGLKQGVRFEGPSIRVNARVCYALNEIRGSEVETDTAGLILSDVRQIKKQPDPSCEPHKRMAYLDTRIETPRRATFASRTGEAVSEGRF